MRLRKYHECGDQDAPAHYFSRQLAKLPLSKLAYRSRETTHAEVDRIVKQGRARTLEDFAALISPAAGERLEQMAARSQQLTQQHFGKAMRFFAPLYLSNECVNTCLYCGFSRNNDIPRETISADETERQVQMLARQGFRSVLLVAGEHPKYVSNGYVEECIRRTLKHVPSVALELGPMHTHEYQPLAQAGAEALIAYQETYHKSTYEHYHTAGPKQFYAWRIDTMERGYDAGFRRLGIAPLFGLYEWRYEVLAMAAHAMHLLKHCWKAQLSVGFPRMRPAAGERELNPAFLMNERELVQCVCAIRMLLPQVGITLSTRESPAIRDGLSTLGITMMSAGASTEPGGYADYDEATWRPKAEQPGEQFHVADERSPAQVAAMIRSRGYEVVWKDFEQSLVSDADTFAPVNGHPAAASASPADTATPAALAANCA